MPTTIKGISSNDGRLHPQFARTVDILSYHPLDAIEREIKKMVTSFCSFYDGIPLVRPESKQSPSWSRSRYFQAGVGVGAGVA